MNFTEYANNIAACGRVITLDAVKGTRVLVEPLIPDDLLDGINVIRDISYGDHERHRLDVFTDPRGDSKPVLLFVHGGGFIGGDKHGEGSPFYSSIGAWAVNNGFAGVNMTYRLAPDNPWPAGIEDLRAAIEFIQENGDQYGLDASRIFLMGQSAGGAHSAHYIAHPEIYGNKPHGLKGCIMLSGVYDFVTMPSTEKEIAYLGEDETLYHERSSLEGLLDIDIPLLITEAQYDPPEFQAQALQLLNAWLGKHGGLPWHMTLLGQNHFSVAMFLGLEHDQLGPVLKRFMDEHS